MFSSAAANALNRSSADKPTTAQSVARKRKASLTTALATRSSSRLRGIAPPPARRPPTPKLNSFLIEQKDTPKNLLQEGLQWYGGIWEELYGDISEIKPFTNNLRMNHQTPQALRYFFSVEERGPTKHATLRCLYGFSHVLRTTGIKPKWIKVRPFDHHLESIVEQITKIVEGRLPEYQGELEFNSLEVKIYHGQDMFRDIVDENGQPLRTDCNNQITYHNDLNFSDQGIQAESDTAQVHPIVTLSLGAGRKLTFCEKWKESSDWEPPGDIVNTFDLQNNLFVLLPGDDCPQKVQNYLYKTQHKAEKKCDGVSVAMVFRKVEKPSTPFSTRTHRWMGGFRKKSREKALKGKVQISEDQKKTARAFGRQHAKRKKENEHKQLQMTRKKKENGHKQLQSKTEKPTDVVQLISKAAEFWKKTNQSLN